jgi:hypothetical protein
MAHECNVRPPLAVTVLPLSLLLVVLVVSCGGVSSVGSASSSPSPTRFVTASPPAIVADGFARVQGTVTDETTKKPLQDVCVVIATGGSCQPASPRTDSNGYWWIDLPANVDWDFIWTKDGYEPAQSRVTSRPGGVLIVIQLKPVT